MKTICLILFSMVAILSLPSCHETCYCGKFCAYFAHDSIQICQPLGGDYYQYMMRRDSLANIYGEPRDTTFDPITVKGSNQSANSIASQLESQGYNCHCNSPR